MKIRYLWLIMGLAILSVGAFTTMSASTTRAASATGRAIPEPTPSDDPTTAGFNAYRGVTIGMKAVDARAKLGIPKDQSAGGDYFQLNRSESVQVIYSADQTVRTISVDYSNDLKTAPTPKDVFGSDVPQQPDGSINKMVRFPKAGYWVSYIRTAGDDPMIVVTIQKIDQS